MGVQSARGGLCMVVRGLDGGDTSDLRTYHTHLSAEQRGDYTARGRIKTLGWGLLF